MITKFVEQKMEQATYKILDDGLYFAEIPGIKGVWASAKKLEDCRKELREVLEDWLLLKLRADERITGLSSHRSSAHQYA